ncbi:MAG: 5-formyltetrahydrofolate cyclo-ligase [bacterium]|nr:5-formyltetrahydrofolate cyclo-ligase [bacterium]
MKQTLSAKHLLRKTCLINLAETTKKDRALAGKKIAHRVLTLLKTKFPKGSGIASFTSFKDEIDTTYLNAQLKENGFSLILPQTNPEALLTFYDENTKQEKTYDDMAAIIVPGIAFDRNGNRLGRGLGYYDRYLAKFRLKKNKPFIIGIGFDMQLFDQIPIEANDQRLNMVITPSFEIIL